MLKAAWWLPARSGTGAIARRKGAAADRNPGRMMSDSAVTKGGGTAPFRSAEL